MCLSNFIEFDNVIESEALIGYRDWRNLIKDSLILESENQKYKWSKIEGPHEVKQENSGIYSYNYNSYNYNSYNYNSHNYYYYYNNYYNNNYNSYNYNYENYNYNYYNLSGIIKQWGKVAIHKTGYRSEYAKIDTLFSIRELDAQGIKEFLDWIKIFNARIEQIAEKYECKVMAYQDFIESEKKQ
jgi:hypothetical protein